MNILQKKYVKMKRVFMVYKLTGGYFEIDRTGKIIMG